MTIIVTPAEIEEYRSQLQAYPDSLKALDILEEWNGDLADTAESIAKRSGIEGVETNADFRWFDQNLEKCQKFICQSEYKDLRNEYISTLIPVLTEFIGSSLGCPPGTATLLATPFTLTIAKQGMDKFCRSSLPSS